MKTGFSQSTYFTVTNILLNELAWSVLFTIYLVPLSFSAILRVLVDSRALQWDDDDLKTALDHNCKLHLRKIKLCYFAVCGDMIISKKFTSLDSEIAYI